MTAIKNVAFGNRISITWFVSLIALALLVRVLLISFTNYDTDGYSLWYDFIVQNGPAKALGQNFAIYTPPYLYLLSIATLVRGVIPKIIAIKLIPICFDLINAIIIFKIVRLKFAAGQIPYLAAAVFLLAPTVIMNSALWGQIDSLYTCFLLLCVFLLLTDRPVFAMIAFGIAISIKAQAAFLGPFLLLMGLKKRIPWYGFAIVPLTYLVVMLPAMIAGRTILDVTTVYLNQAAELQIPSFNAPNWYVFVPQSTYAISMPIGMSAAGLIITAWIYIHARRSFSSKIETILFTAFISLAMMPFLLPKMHDRYFYPADVFSIILAFLMPQFWFVPICYQVISSLVYSIFLFDAPRSTVLVLATELNTIAIAYLSWKHFHLSKPTQDIHEDRITA